MTTIVEFLLARVAEDEAAARIDLVGANGGEVHASYGDAAERVLAECEAKRRIVGAHRDCVCDDWTNGLPDECLIYRAMAAVYADHPDYNEEWRP